MDILMYFQYYFPPKSKEKRALQECSAIDNWRRPLTVVEKM